MANNSIIIWCVLSSFVFQETFCSQKICGILTTTDQSNAFDLAMQRLRGAFPTSNFSSMKIQTRNGYEANAWFQEYAGSGCQIVIGPGTSALATDVRCISVKTRIPYFSSGATNDNLLWDNPYFFRLFSGDVAGGQALAETVKRFGWRQM